MLFRPHTGRTHQLRVAAKSLGLPLAGDPLYATSGFNGNDITTPVLSVPRTCLHATALYIPAECLGLKQDFDAVFAATLFALVAAAAAAARRYRPCWFGGTSVTAIIRKRCHGPATPARGCQACMQ
jgi:hypothetical protein